MGILYRLFGNLSDNVNGDTEKKERKMELWPRFGTNLYLFFLEHARESFEGGFG